MSITLGPIYNYQNNKVREWRVTISLYDQHDKLVPISGSVEDVDVKEGYYASYVTAFGYSDMKITVSTPTIVTVGKNLGKKNETNVLTQAFKDCESKYNLKVKSGYSTDAKQQTTETSTTISVPFPMAVKSWKDQKEKLVYPLYIQPKLDGIRMLVRFHNNEVQLFTRRLHDIVGFKKLKGDLGKMFQKSKLTSFYIDGELYSHGVNLQTISGIVRNESIDESVKETLQYYVFDCFDVNQKGLGFEERFQYLRSFVSSHKSDMIVLNDTLEVKTSSDADKQYNRFVKDGYEGAIYKSKQKPYEFDFNREKRSSWYLKRKKQADAEYPIVGFAQGKGKDSGCIVFELQAPNGKKFNSVPNGTYEYRKELYEQALKSFNTKFKNKLAKVVFDDLSKDDVPLRGRIVQIDRDLSFD